MYDILIKNGLIVDGSGRPAFSAGYVLGLADFMLFHLRWGHPFGLLRWSTIGRGSLGNDRRKVASPPVFRLLATS